MNKQYFAALHSSGARHLRATNGHGNYEWAVVTGNASRGANFSSRLDLAQREAEVQRRWLSDVEVVAAVEIDKADYNRLLKANKRAYAVTFRGKKFTKTIVKGASPLTHAVGVYKPARKVRIDIDPSWGTTWHVRHPEGFFIQEDREEFSVFWYDTEELATEAFNRASTQDYETVQIFSLEA